MRVLHLDLKAVLRDAVELRCFWDNPNEYVGRTLLLSEISDLTRQSEQGYYVSPRLREDLATTGQRLFDWLNGREGLLVSKLAEASGELVVLAIAVAHQLSHLPWEVLHDGAQFLVQRFPAVVPLRWLSSDQVTHLTVTPAPQNRALRVMFMATSPRGVEPVLDYEQEEAQILKATARPSIGLTVEESGCLEELGYLINSHGRGYFDVVHLTGHATLEDSQPRFLTETSIGEPYRASAEDIACALKTPFPPLVFLSGCRTGQAGNAGAVPSMAEQLLSKGAAAVLGWGQNVLDTNATAAAAALYGALSCSNSLAEAVAQSYQSLIQQEARDWHLLRLYVSKNLPERLVLPERTSGWQRAPRPSVATEFLDPVTEKVRVPTRESFVGRRRQLQNCLRALTPPSEKIGVLIHGMGGLGKSSLAARLCDRLPQFKRLVWQGRLDPQNFVNKLADALNEETLRQRLLRTGEALKFRLRSVFTALAEQGTTSFLLVFDDFEANLTEQGTTYRLNSPANEVLQAFVWAIQDTYASHRFILTSRYDFEMSAGQVLYKQPFDAFQGADLEKKCSRLSALKRPELEPNATEAEVVKAKNVLELQKQAKQLADGNPRLLETLNDEVLAKADIDRQAQLQKLAKDPTDLRKQVLEDRVLRQIEEELQEVLAKGLVFELPVPRAAFEDVTLNSASAQPEPVLIDRAIALGLLEVSPDQMVRVPRILPLHLPQDDPSLAAQATQTLYSCWWQSSSTEEQALEVHRLALIAGTKDIAAELGAALGHRWYTQSRFRDAVKLGEKTVVIAPDYRIYHSLARSQEVLGVVEAALENYQKARNICPEEDQQEKAAILHNLAGIYAQQGQVQQAIELYQQSLALKESIGDVQGKAATLHCMAIIYAQQGQVQQAIELYQQSLAAEESIGNVQGKAATLHCMAIIYAQQGQVQQAIELYQQSLALKESIGNVQGKAATLHQMAGIYAQQGQVQQAIELYQQSLAAEESIGDVRGKAATLANMAYLAGKQGDTAKQLQLNLQAAEILGQMGAYVDLVTVLSNLGTIPSAHQLAYLAQALWLALKIQPPFADVFALLRVLFNQIPKGDPLEPLLATTAYFLCASQDKNYPKLEQFQQQAWQMLTYVANSQGIETQEALQTWMANQQLNDPNVFLPQLHQQLEAMVSDQWLFDRSPLG